MVGTRAGRARRARCIHITLAFGAQRHIRRERAVDVHVRVVCKTARKNSPHGQGHGNRIARNRHHHIKPRRVGLRLAHRFRAIADGTGGAVAFLRHVVARPTMRAYRAAIEWHAVPVIVPTATPRRRMRLRLGVGSGFRMMTGRRRMGTRLRLRMMPRRRRRWVRWRPTRIATQVRLIGIYRGTPARTRGRYIGAIMEANVDPIRRIIGRDIPYKHRAS